MGYFDSVTFQVKTAVATFLASFEKKLGYFIFQYLVSLRVKCCQKLSAHNLAAETREFSEEFFTISAQYLALKDLKCLALKDLLQYFELKESKYTDFKGI